MLKIMGIEVISNVDVLKSALRSSQAVDSTSDCKKRNLKSAIHLLRRNVNESKNE